jgi:hypothetical protein
MFSEQNELVVPSSRSKLIGIEFRFSPGSWRRSMVLPKTLAAAVALLAIGVHLSAQSPAPPPVTLPSSLALADIRIGLLRKSGGGCVGRCVYYQVSIRGDGTVRYEDLADPPLPPRERTVPAAEVIALTNDFVGARFFEAAARYEGRSFYVMQGQQLLLRQRGGADGAEWDLSLRLGGLEKSVHLYRDFPEHLGQLRDRVDQIGGPQSWTAR